MAAVSRANLVRRVNQRLAFGMPPSSRSADPGVSVSRLAHPTYPDRGVLATPTPLTFSVPEPPTGRGRTLEEQQEVDRVEGINRRAVENWWLRRLAAAEHQLSERMTWVWHGHFATSAAGVRPVAALLQQNETQRRLALKSFRELAREMVTDTAMILWLDGHRSTIKSPNENLAREFMELFTLGPGNYTEQDVREGARALTGWTIIDGHARFTDKRHDSHPMTILGVTKNFDAVSLVDLLVSRRESAEFVVRRLWARLMGGRPAPPATHSRLLSAFGAGDIQALVTAIARDPAFADEAYSVIRSPVEWFIGIVRSVEVDLRAWDDKSVTSANALLRQMGQLPFNPPNVGGWPSGRVWLAAAPAARRYQLAALVGVRAKLAERTKSVTPSARADLWARTFGVTWSPRSRNAVMAASAADSFAVAACAPEVVICQ